MKYYSSNLFTLIESLTKKENYLSPAKKLKISVQLFETLTMLHENDIIHRNIKTKNILINHYQTEEDSYLLTDFSFTCYLKEKDKLNQPYETLDCWPPEAWLNQFNRFDFSLDIWNMGCILYELWKEESYPWAGAKEVNEETKNKVLSEIKDYFCSSLPSDCLLIQRKIENLLKHYLLHYDPYERYTAKEALKYFKNLEPLVSCSSFTSNIY